MPEDCWSGISGGALPYRGAIGNLSRQRPAPKGTHETAQGNALGNRCPVDSRPESAARRSGATQGAALIGCRYQKNHIVIPAFALICIHISAGISAATRPGPGRPRLKGQRPPAPSGLRFRACFGGRRPPSREISASLDRTRVAIGLSILARLTANRPKCQACRPPAMLAGRKHAHNGPEAFVFSDGAFQAPVPGTQPGGG